MDFVGTRIFVDGPTVSPQPAPFKQSATGFSDKSLWDSIGDWEISEHSAITRTCEESELICRQLNGSFVCEVNLRALSTDGREAAFGVCSFDKEVSVFGFLVFPKRNRAVIYWYENDKLIEEPFPLPDDFVPNAFHLLRIDVNGPYVKITLDEAIVRSARLSDRTPKSLSLTARDVKAEFSGFALTCGFEDLFERSEAEIENHGWKQLSGDGFSIVKKGDLLISAKREATVILTKCDAQRNYEFAANLRLVEVHGDDCGLGFVLFTNDGQITGSFDIPCNSQILTFSIGEHTYEILLPETMELVNYHQFRIVVVETHLSVQMEGNILGEFLVPDEKTYIGIFCRSGTAAFEMVRHTVL